MIQVIGFNITKIAAQRTSKFKQGSSAITINVEFTSVDEDTVSLVKESSVARVGFKFSLQYAESEVKKDQVTADLVIEGHLLLAMEKAELKDLIKSWKKKIVPDQMRNPLMNVIFKKCAARSLSLQDELGLPSHIQIPQLK